MDKEPMERKKRKNRKGKREREQQMNNRFQIDVVIAKFPLAINFCDCAN